MPRKKLSPFQVYLASWNLQTENIEKAEYHSMVERWKRMTKSKKSFYIKASRADHLVDTNQKIFDM